MTTLKITKPVVLGLVPKSERYTVWDATLPGLGVQVQPSGHKSFVLKYRTRDGLQRKPTLGAFGPLTVEQARAEATRVLAMVRLGSDPAGDKRAARSASTVDDAADRYMSEHARIKKKPRSADSDEVNLRLHVRPRWGTRKIASVTSNDVMALHHAMRETPGAANRVVALLSKMFNLCEAWGLRPQGSNPCRHVQKYPEKRLHQHVSEIELARLAKVLREAEAAFQRIADDRPEEKDSEIAADPRGVAIIRTLILTGMRRSEVLNLKWSEVDRAGHLLRLEDSKTGAKVLPLSSAAEEIIKAQKPVPGSPWVFPGRDPRKAFVGLSKITARLYKLAKLPKDFRPAHDWRHNFGTAGTGANLSLTLVGSLLGHKSPLTTKRYAQAADDPQRAASELVAEKLAGAMSKETES